jgi:prepilin-type N-terminal cleavage/methylation domain-containing protein
MHTTIRRRGFTLIELMVVVVVLGILAGMAVVRLSGTRDRALIAKMRSDLRTLAVRQESFFSENERFSSSEEELKFGVTQGMQLTILEGDVSGWSATLHPVGAQNPICAVYFANAAPVAPAEREGTITCE